MLLMAEKGICHAIHRHSKASDIYVKNYDKNFESSYLIYLDAYNLYGWAMSQKLSVSCFEWMEKLSEFDERFIKNCDANNDKEYILAADVEYPKNLCNLHCDLSFLPERSKIKKCKKLACNIHNKENLLCT